jgi:hypothetical protein
MMMMMTKTLLTEPYFIDVIAMFMEVKRWLVFSEGNKVYIYNNHTS